MTNITNTIRTLTTKRLVRLATAGPEYDRLVVAAALAELARRAAA